MEKRKNNLKKLIILVLFSIIIGVLSILLLNISYFFSPKSSKGVNRFKYSISEKIEDDGEKKKILKLDFDNEYIGKLVINYKTLKDVDAIIRYQTLNSYGNKEEYKLNEKFDNEVTQSINNLNAKVYNLTVEYSESDFVKFDSVLSFNKFNFNFLVFGFGFSVGLLIAILFIFRDQIYDRKIHIYFFVFGAIFGCVFIFLQPNTTIYSWDDQIHFMNVYEFFGGNHNWSVGEYSMVDMTHVGRDSINSIDEQINQVKYLDKKELSGYSTHTTHFITTNKIVYFPSAVGYHFCKLLGFPFSFCFKIGKFFNLLVYLLIMTYAIKITNIGKKLISFIGLMPSTIFLATQYSYDPPVTAGVTLGIVVLLKWLTEKEYQVDFKSFITFLFGMLYGCFPKAVYIPLILIFLFIPKNKFKSKFFALYLKLGILFIFIMMLATFISGDSFSSNLAGDLRGGNTNSAEQLKLILNYPIGYIKILKDTYISQFFTKLIGMDTLGRYAYIGGISSNSYYLLFIALVFISITDNKNNLMNFWQKMLILTLVLGICLLIWTALYISFTPVGSNTINGVQSRYFIPLIFPFLLCFQTPKISNKFKQQNYNLVMFCLLSVVVMFSIYQLILIPFCL